MSTKKKVVVQIPGITGVSTDDDRYAIEIEALDRANVDVVEVIDFTTEEFLEQAHDAHAILTSWGRHWPEKVISKMPNLEIIAVGRIGVDMVDVTTATKAGVGVGIHFFSVSKRK
jgi:phosphoglycerate dehydrogenase-like enzyme